MKKLTLNIIEYHRDTNQVSWEYQYLSELDRIAIANLVFEASIDYEDKHGNYAMIILSSQQQLDRFRNILDSNYIQHFIRDITTDILNNKSTIHKMLSNIKVDNEELISKFVDKVEKWIYTNLDLDIVLDIINEQGIDSLRQVDKQFLENYGKF